MDYGDIVPIFEVLEANMRTAILEVLGPRICHYGFDELDYPKENTCVHTLQIDPDVWKQISRHQVFAEVICDDDARFVVNVERMAMEPPKLYIYSPAFLRKAARR